MCMFRVTKYIYKFVRKNQKPRRLDPILKFVATFYSSLDLCEFLLIQLCLKHNKSPEKLFDIGINKISFYCFTN